MENSDFYFSSLRRGSWVEYKDERLQISDIDPENKLVIFTPQPDEEYPVISWKCVKPFVITKEAVQKTMSTFALNLDWLDKAKFAINMPQRDDEHWYVILRDDKPFAESRTFVGAVKYVHELQNAFELCHMGQDETAQAFVLGLLLNIK